MFETYTPSGKLSTNSFLLFGAASVTIFPALALAYSYATWYIPIVQLNALITIAFAFSIGLTVNRFVIDYGKVRNPIIASLFGFTSVVITYYFHCVIWVDLVLNSGKVIGNSTIGIIVSNIELHQIFELISRPELLFNLILEINSEGIWAISDAPVSGTPLTIIWSAEFIILSIAGILLTYDKAKKPFSENTNQWLKKKILPFYEFIENPELLLTEFSQGKTDTFNALKKISGNTFSLSEFIIYTADHSDIFLSVTNKKLQQTSKSERTTKHTEILQNAKITSQLYLKLIQKENTNVRPIQ